METPPFKDVLFGSPDFISGGLAPTRCRIHFRISLQVIKRRSIISSSVSPDLNQNMYVIEDDPR